MIKPYKLLIPLLALWLLGWIILSWPAVQDDALIHLRYADNLLHTHHISFDGVHPNYGASSILYITVLALFRNFISSSDLPRGVSTAAHIILFAGLAAILIRFIPSRSSLARLLGLIFLFMIATPSAVRWLDDGMETSFGLCTVTLICWHIFIQSRRSKITGSQYIFFLILGFFAVLLRTEFISLCGICFAILFFSKRSLDRSTGHSQISFQNLFQTVIASSPLFLGGVFALAAIFLRMHVVLPDTALAKSHGIGAWHDVVFVTPKILAGGLSFGLGLPILWVLTVVLLLSMRRLSMALVFANSVFPIIFTLAVIRGQEVQGARYLAWTFFFPILWNIFELASPHSTSVFEPTILPRPSSLTFTYGLLVIMLLVQPVEARLMYPVLNGRATMMKTIQSQHLEVLKSEQGVATDVGFIGYFTQAPICDLVGLVNGREAARMTNEARATACFGRQPGFIFGDYDQIRYVRSYTNLDGWQICGQYSFNNVREPSIHYLVLPPSTASTLCLKSTGQPPRPLTTLVKGGSHL